MGICKKEKQKHESLLKRNSNRKQNKTKTIHDCITSCDPSKTLKKKTLFANGSTFMVKPIFKLTSS